MNQDKEIDLSVEIPGDIPDDVWFGTSSSVIDTVKGDSEIVEGSKSDLDLNSWYDDKNNYLRSHSYFRELTTDDFLRLIFCRDDFDNLPFEEEWCEAYEWWTENPRSAKRPPQHKYVYNGIAQAIYKKSSDTKNESKIKTYIITSHAEKLHTVLQHPFVIMSPVSYTGKRRLKNNARYLYAIAIDIDSVDAQNVENLLYQSDPTRKYITFPQPNIIVNSGNGIHIYYLLETPAPMFNDIYKILNKLKKELTRRVWNKGTTHENPEKPQFQGNCQGFRLPGTQTKSYKNVTAFLNINPNVKPYYKVEDLAYGGGGWITEQELQLVRKGIYNPHRCTLKQARELWPEWYERRIIQGHKPNRWYIKRDLYDWWKRQIMVYATVGHRYFCMMALAIYAKKCNISEDEFRKDLEAFIEVMDGLSYTQNIEDRFTLEDAEDAASAFKEDYCTFPLDDIRAITGVPVERNRTRKGRKQNEHLFDIRAIRDARCEKKGVSWRSGNGRKDKFKLIKDWKAANPNSTKYACAKELGIDYKTVLKWWNITEREWSTATIPKKSTSQKLREVAEFAMDEASKMPEHENISKKERSVVGKDLVKAMDNSQISLENIFRTMGVPESDIPEVITSFLEFMLNPQFKQKFLEQKANGNVPPIPIELIEKLIRVSEDRKNK